MRLRILFVEDSEDDVELMLRRLRDAGLEPQWDRVAGELELRTALADAAWDVALVDFNLPGFGGPQALAVVREAAPDTPAITVSGAIDEDTAVATLTAGAVDYVLKDNLARLAPAVRRAVEGADLRRRHRVAADSARRALFATDNAPIAAITVAADGTIVYANAAQGRLRGVPAEEQIGQKVWESNLGLSLDWWRTVMEAVDRDGSFEGEATVQRLDGQARLIDVMFGAIDHEGTRFYVGWARDITARHEAERRARESERRFVEFADHVPAELWIGTPDQEYVYVNEWLARDLGRDRDDMIGTRSPDAWGEEGPSRTLPMYQRAARGEVVDDVSTWSVGGRDRTYRSTFFPIVSETGPPLIGGFSLDVTDEYEAQAEILRHAERLRRTVEGAVLAMGHVVETRDPYTAGHERRVAELAVAVARELGLAPAEVEGLRLAALIHDIGKIAVPAEILAKPGRLSVVEFNLIREHARAGYEILAEIDFDAPVAEIVLQHHERLDGSGYPAALAGEAILPAARVLAVADVVEAMSSHRPYRPALGMAAALAEVREGAGARYDAEVAAACLRVVEEQGFAFTD